MFPARYIAPNFFTSLNFLLGVAAICWPAGLFGATSSYSDPHYNPHFIYAMGANFICYCVLLDKLDGFAARLCHASSAFGAQFDSLADLVAFGLAPAFLWLFAYRGLAPDFYAQNFVLVFAVGAVYVLCAAMRLAKYNAMDSDSYPDYFSGMPSTFAGAFNAVLLLLVSEHQFFERHADLLWIPLALQLLSGVLMVCPLFLSKLKIRKNKLINAFQLVNIVLVYVVVFATVWPSWRAAYLMAIIALYFFVGFAYGLVNRKKIVAGQKEMAGAGK
jgi:CDP-diacylglycerol--serine O-phosphatidyltransferase